MDCNVGELRAQSAYSSPTDPVIVYDVDSNLELTVVEFYPDTVTFDGTWQNCFKIAVKLKSQC